MPGGKSRAEGAESDAGGGRKAYDVEIRRRWRERGEEIEWFEGLNVSFGRKLEREEWKLKFTLARVVFEEFS